MKNMDREGTKGLRRPSLAALAAALGFLIGGLVYAQTRNFEFRGVLVRVITPNGDGRNDYAILCFENPKDSSVTGTVYDLWGRTVSGMVYIKDPGGVDPTVASCRGKFPPGGALTQPEAMSWDGKSNGARVTSGVYVYQLRAEGTAAAGALVVAR